MRFWLLVMRVTTFLVGVFILALPAGPAASPRPSTSAQAPTPAPAAGALLETYCVSCHNARVRTAGLALDNLDAVFAGREPGDRVA